MTVVDKAAPICLNLSLTARHCKSDRKFGYMARDPGELCSTCLSDSILIIIGLGISGSLAASSSARRIDEGDSWVYSLFSLPIPVGVKSQVGNVQCSVLSRQTRVVKYLYLME